MNRLTPLLLCVAALGPGLSAPAEESLRKSRLSSPTPGDEILRYDIDGDGTPDCLERWWNGRRCRWLDEGGTLRDGDVRGDMVNACLQVDQDGDGFYDGWNDMNVKWADNAGAGRPDMMVVVINPPMWPQQKGAPNWDPHWMVFLDVEKDGVLGHVDWSALHFDCWMHSNLCDWFPDYNGDAVFLKSHFAPQCMEDPRFNWENPFAFYDFDGDGCSETAIRWIDRPEIGKDDHVLRWDGIADDVLFSFDLDNDSQKGNETDYDMSFHFSRGKTGKGFDYRHCVNKFPKLKAPGKFLPCFQWTNWRTIDELIFPPHAEAYDDIWKGDWGECTWVFDEDDDDHRWERVELYYPVVKEGAKEVPTDPYVLNRWNRRKPGEAPGVSGHPQADSLGDRGEFDRDNSGKGKLYVGAWDRKLHLYGAETGVWLVDERGEFHGGGGAPTLTPDATRVGEVVRYADTDGNGFIDRIEFDHDGDRVVDRTIDLLAYTTAENPHPDEAPLLDTAALKWQGLHAAFTTMANDAWQEALALYRAAWRRGLTTPELDRLSFAASVGERYDHACRLKEKLMRRVGAHLAASAKQAKPEEAARLEALAKELTALCATGKIAALAEKLAEVPAVP